MAREFKLPDLGEGIHEGEIVEVFVAPGDSVKEGDPLMEVETDKAVTAIPSPATGRVAEVRVKAGDVVHVGDVLVVFEAAEPEKTGADTAEAPGGEAPRGAKPSAEPPAAAGREATGAPKRAAPAPAPKAPEGRGAEGDAPQGRPVPASPATRRLARELDVDLCAVKGSGPEGLVTAEDVRRQAQPGGGADREKAPAEAREAEAAAPGGPPAAPEMPDFSRWGPVEHMPLRSVRRATARQMALAWSQIPHVSNQDEVDVTELEALRERLKDGVAAEGGRLTLTVFALKAAAAALKRFPRFNASIDMAAGVIVLKRYCHIGVAVDSERGLLVPVIRDVDRKSVRELAGELHDLVTKARAGKLEVAELQGGTFTITNAGAVGGGYFAPIINFPQAAILGMGRARLQPVVRATHPQGFDIQPRQIMPLVLCFDHRVADGAEAIRFMRMLSACLEDPEQLLLNA
jgi:pyruvate dehydrogenase E2 component (dihydrolipoamide acetyltransferase)